MPETAKVFEHREWPGRWRVECFDDHGECEMTIFSGPTAYDRAIRYANTQYQWFQIISLSPRAFVGRRACTAAVSSRCRLRPADMALAGLSGVDITRCRPSRDLADPPQPWPEPRTYRRLASSCRTNDRRDSGRPWSRC